jgi:dethiobiotin synthetase
VNEPPPFLKGWRIKIERNSGMKALFVTGTDTGVGKTVITGCLAKYLSEKGYNVITQKWIQTGSNSNSPSDIELHLKIMNRNIDDMKEYLSYALPYVFKSACSAHLASKIENKRININKIKKSFKILSNRFDFIIIEGLGGVLVPYNKRRLVIDIVKDLDLPVLVVVENKLGAINHTLLTIEVLNIRKIKIFGLVFNNRKCENKPILEDNPRIIKALTKQKIFGALPREIRHRKLYERFIPIGDRIFRQLPRYERVA